LIVFMLGAGVVAIVVKNNKATPTAQPKPAIIASSVETPTVSPSTTVQASRQTPAPAPVNSLKKSPADELANVPPMPVTGVGRSPAGFVFVLLAGSLAAWLRRTARA
jgi:hypothetical protein